MFLKTRLPAKVFVMNKMESENGWKNMEGVRAYVLYFECADW